MLGFGPFCLDLGHIAWIWAIWQNLGQNGPQRRRSPEDGAGGTDGRMDRCTDGQIPPVFYRTLSPSGPLPKRKKENQDPEVDQHTRYGIAFLLQIVVLLRGPELASYFKESMENMARCCIKI